LGWSRSKKLLYELNSPVRWSGWIELKVNRIRPDWLGGLRTGLAHSNTPAPSLLSLRRSGPLAVPATSSSSAPPNRIEESSAAAGEGLGAQRGMASGSSNGEPSTAPQANRWYDLRLGSSCRDPSPTAKFCTLRCKPLVPFLPLPFFFSTQPAEL
jgi:hypothetical protein